MDADTRSELNTMHERINGMRDRVVTLETQQPHTVAALARIEQSVNKLNGHVSKVVWIILALFLTALFKVAMTGNLNLPLGA